MPHGSAAPHLQPVIEAAHRWDAPGIGKDGQVLLYPSFPEQLPGEQAHLGTEGRVDAQMAMDLIGQDHGLPLLHPMALNAIADHVCDIVGIKIRGQEKRFQNALHRRCRALMTKYPPTIWIRMPGQPMRMSWMACRKLKSMRNSTAIPTI